MHKNAWAGVTNYLHRVGLAHGYGLDGAARCVTHVEQPRTCHYHAPLPYQVTPATTPLALNHQGGKRYLPYWGSDQVFLPRQSWSTGEDRMVSQANFKVRTSLEVQQKPFSPIFTIIFHGYTQDIFIPSKGSSHSFYTLHHFRKLT